MTFAVLPVKSPARAKQRLAAVLTAEERSHLAWLLYRHTLGILLSISGFEKVIVASSDRGILDHARGEGAAVLCEPSQTSHSHSADWAATHCQAMGAARVLLVPIDVPLLSPTDIEEVIASSGRASSPSLVIVPSASGSGTNALLQSPPGVIPCRFGPGSFAAHQREACELGVGVTIASPPGLTFDLDEPEDVLRLRSHHRSDDVSRYLAEIQAAKRTEKFLSLERFTATPRS